MKIDYHTHTSLSKDNEQSIDELCSACLDRGIQEVCITEHIDFNPKDTCYGGFDWHKHLANIEYARNKYNNLSVKIGGEFDAQFLYLDKIKKTIKQCRFDYILGSCHYCNNQVLFNHPEFFNGKTQKQAYEEYFTSELEVINLNLFDGVSHFDLIKRTGGGVFGSYNPLEYRDIIAECMKAIIKNDMTLEVNSSGLRHTGKDIYPNKYIIELYKDLGGKNITYGSDGHSYEQDGYELEYVYDLLKSIGFRYLVTYNRRKKVFIEY